MFPLQINTKITERKNTEKQKNMNVVNAFFIIPNIVFVFVFSTFKATIPQTVILRIQGRPVSRSPYMFTESCIAVENCSFTMIRVTVTVLHIRHIRHIRQEQYYCLYILI